MTKEFITSETAEKLRAGFLAGTIAAFGAGAGVGFLLGLLLRAITCQ
jgi:hypothetical protein